MHNLAEQSMEPPLPRAPQVPLASQPYTPADAYRDTFPQPALPVVTETGAVSAQCPRPTQT
jgi:hypothetical protein